MLFSYVVYSNVVIKIVVAFYDSMQISIKLWGLCMQETLF